ncbi:hypothetical protein [Thomasclavelia cocleata]|uniref:hypothetical protein n=2 Tax=Thomasclavelia cocleata TaxID=69824 RepID=UPI0024332CF1|nr:hypothetical protein [Thomasclavelia cocleata]
MKQINNWNEIKEAGEFESLPAGGYVAVIKKVEDDTSKECLKISFDIAEGQYKDYYLELYKSMNFWGGSFYRSYKEKAQSFFKGFITAVEESNSSFKWNWDEQKLKGQRIGIVLREEEYIPQQGPNAGKVRTRLIVDEVRSADKIRKGDYKIKEKKLLENQLSTSNNPFKNGDGDNFDIMEDDIQF